MTWFLTKEPGGLYSILPDSDFSKTTRLQNILNNFSRLHNLIGTDKSSPETNQCNWRNAKIDVRRERYLEYIYLEYSIW